MSHRTNSINFYQQQQEALQTILKMADDEQTGNLPPDVRLRVIALSAQRMRAIEVELMKCHTATSKPNWLHRLFKH